MKAVDYAPTGPINGDVSAPFVERQERREAFLDALAGVELGTEDISTVEWLAGWDDHTARTVVSLLLRVRATGGAK
jgi:hypothetical protein